MAKLTKRLKKAYEGIDVNKQYNFDEAVKMIKERATAKFDETIEIAVNLNLDPRKAEQNLRGVVSLPHGTGKTVRVCVFARGNKVEEAQKAGAEIVGGDELVDQIMKGELQFDRCIATPDMMVTVGKLGKVLGPRGLMPNPKLGTVTMDVAEAVKAVKGGQIEYRTEKTGIIHAGVGKSSFSAGNLSENARALLSILSKSRPAGVKGAYMKKVSVSSTMGPSVRVDLSTLNI